MDDLRRADPLARARDLAETIAAAADETEQVRRLPQSLLDRLHKARLFRMLYPRSIGGDEVDPGIYVLAVGELAQADCSVGWCVSIANSIGLFAPYLGLDEAREAFGDARATCAWGTRSSPAARSSAASATSTRSRSRSNPATLTTKPSAKSSSASPPRCSCNAHAALPGGKCPIPESGAKRSEDIPERRTFRRLLAGYVGIGDVGLAYYAVADLMPNVSGDQVNWSSVGITPGKVRFLRGGSASFADFVKSATAETEVDVVGVLREPEGVLPLGQTADPLS
jgi:hypothetical protein